MTSTARPWRSQQAEPRPAFASDPHEPRAAFQFANALSLATAAEDAAKTQLRPALASSEAQAALDDVSTTLLAQARVAASAGLSSSAPPRAGADAMSPANVNAIIDAVRALDSHKRALMREEHPRGCRYRTIRSVGAVCGVHPRLIGGIGMAH